MTDGTGTGTAPLWFDTVIPKGADNVPDPAMLDYIKNRGYDKVDAGTAAIKAMAAHREAEKLIGVPANELLRMPKDTADAEGWTRFNDRIGVPKEAKEYDVSTVKIGEKPLDAKLIEKLGPALQQAHVSKGDAAAVAKAIADTLVASQTVDTTAAEAALNAEKQALSVDWNANTQQNLLIARNTAKSLGID